MMRKRLLRPERRRAVPNRFSWVDHRLVRERHLERCTSEALARASIREDRGPRRLAELLADARAAS